MSYSFRRARVAGLLLACALPASAPFVHAEVPDSAWDAPSTYYSNLTSSSGVMLQSTALRTRLQVILDTGDVSVPYDQLKLSMPITDRAYGAPIKDASGNPSPMVGVYDRVQLPGYWGQPGDLEPRTRLAPKPARRQ